MGYFLHVESTISKNTYRCACCGRYQECISTEYWVPVNMVDIFKHPIIFNRPNDEIVQQMLKELSGKTGVQRTAFCEKCRPATRGLSKPIIRAINTAIVFGFAVIGIVNSIGYLIKLIGN